MATTVPHRQTQTRPFTVAEFEALPDDGNRYELIGGVLGISPAPEIAHQLVQALVNGEFMPIEQSAGVVRSKVLPRFEVSLGRLFRSLGPASARSRRRS